MAEMDFVFQHDIKFLSLNFSRNPMVFYHLIDDTIYFILFDGQKKNIDEWPLEYKENTKKNTIQILC